MKNNIKMITHDGIDFIFIFRDSKVYINWKKTESVYFDNTAFCFNDFNSKDAHIVIDVNTMNTKEDKSAFYEIEFFGYDGQYLNVKLEKSDLFL